MKLDGRVHLIDTAICDVILLFVPSTASLSETNNDHQHVVEINMAVYCFIGRFYEGVTHFMMSNSML
jgi:hypothetical protein